MKIILLLLILVQIIASRNATTIWANIGTNGTLMNNFIGLNGDVYSITGGSTPNQVWRFNRFWSEWSYLTPGAASAIGVTSTQMYAISVNGKTIWVNNPEDDTWSSSPIRTITSPQPIATALISGGNQIYYISDYNGLVYRYENTPNNWTTLNVTIDSHPFTKYVASGDNFYGFHSSSGKVYTFIAGVWTDISPDFFLTVNIIGGEFGLIYAVDSYHNLLYHYSGIPHVWNITSLIVFGTEQYTCDSAGLFSIFDGYAPRDGIYRSITTDPLILWPQVAELAPTNSTLTVYDGSGILADQLIMANASIVDLCFLLLIA